MIKQGIKDTLPHIYKDLVQLKTQQDQRVEELAREHGISLEIARKVKDKIGLDDTEDKIADMLYEAQSKSFCPAPTTACFSRAGGGPGGHSRFVNDARPKVRRSLRFVDAGLMQS